MFHLYFLYILIDRETIDNPMIKKIFISLFQNMSKLPLDIIIALLNCSSIIGVSKNPMINGTQSRLLFIIKKPNKPKITIKNISK